MVGRLLSFWEGLFSCAMLVSGRVTRIPRRFSIVALTKSGSMMFNVLFRPVHSVKHIYTPWKFNISPLQVGHHKRKFIFQPPIFRVYEFQGGYNHSNPYECTAIWPKGQTNPAPSLGSFVGLSGENRKLGSWGFGKWDPLFQGNLGWWNMMKHYNLAWCMKEPKCYNCQSLSFVVYTPESSTGRPWKFDCWKTTFLLGSPTIRGEMLNFQAVYPVSHGLCCFTAHDNNEETPWLFRLYRA